MEVIRIIISKQILYLLTDTKIVKKYPISTSKYGAGNKAGSNKTPLGNHVIYSKIGTGKSIGVIFSKRRNTGKIVQIYKKPYSFSSDLIITRILRLRGLQNGINCGEGIDSFKRCIYIHGTPEEYLIGKTVSHGCIRMKNKHIIELFNLVRRGTLVEICR